MDNREPGGVLYNETLSIKATQGMLEQPIRKVKRLCVVI